MLRVLAVLILLDCSFPILASALTGDPCSSIENSVAVYDGKSGEFYGCRMTKIEKDSLYDKLGIKVGDKVHPAGYPVKIGPAKAISLHSEMKEGIPQKDLAEKIDQ